MGCKGKWAMVNQVEKSLSALNRAGMGVGFQPYDLLYIQRGKLLATVGIKVPRVPTILRSLFGFSTGTVRVFWEPEREWWLEVRDTPEGRPRYRGITMEQGVQLCKEPVDVDLVHALMEPDLYAGES